MTTQQEAADAREERTESRTAPDVPAIGTVVETYRHGRQQVMDVMGLPFPEQTVFLRPEGGGREWTVPVSGLARVIAPTEIGEAGPS